MGKKKTNFDAGLMQMHQLYNKMGELSKDDIVKMIDDISKQKKSPTAKKLKKKKLMPKNSKLNEDLDQIMIAPPPQLPSNPSYLAESQPSNQRQPSESDSLVFVHSTTMDKQPKNIKRDLS